MAFVLLCGAALSQEPRPSQTPLYGGSGPSTLPQQQSGSATGGVFAPVLDAEKRPITAGGFVKAGPKVFQDISEKAGLTVWQHKMGTPQKPYILETIGSGACLFDYDRDGWLDIYLVNGSTYDAENGKTEPPHAALFHNNHDGTFTNVANIAGVTNDRWGFGCAVGDYDNDGWPDIYVGNYGKNRLYHNNHEGTFTDLAEAAGVALGNWSTGPSFGDYDGDGWLDLFVPGYIHWDMNNLPASGTKAVGYANDDHNHWVGLSLTGGAKSPHDAVGSTVYLTASGIRQRGDVMSGGSFESSNDFRVHFGLGESTTVDKVEIRWPDGAKETYTLPGVDRYFAIEEGKGLVRSVYDAIAADRRANKSSGTHSVYPKNRTDQLSAKQLAKILAKVTRQAPEGTPQAAPERFTRVVRMDGVFVSVCVECGETVAESPHPSAMAEGEQVHECPGPTKVTNSN
jgi:hypothetical protein